MGIYITGDTHGDISEFRSRLARCRLSEDDILIITGDFGFGWGDFTIREWGSLRRPFTVLFCDGNHENFDILDALETRRMFGSEVGVFGENTYRLLSGRMYDIRGLKTFVFGGASSIDRGDREPGVSWWPEEIPSHAVFETARQTLKDNGYTFDLFVSHTCDPETKKQVLKAGRLNFCDPVENMMAMLEDEIRKNGGSYGRHYFGHFHEDVDIGDKHCLCNRVVPILEGV